MSQSVFIVSVALIKYDFYFDETENKPHFKEIHTLNYNIMQMIFSCGIFLFMLL